MKPRTVKLEDIRHIPDLTIGDDTDSWQPVNLADLDDQPPVQPILGNTGLVYPGKRHVFSGPQESAKTLAAYIIALQVIRTDGIVVIIDFEMGRWDARNRLRELGANPEELSHVAYVDPSEPATSDRIERLALLYPQLVIVDAAAGAYDNLSLDDNKRTDVERFTRIYIRQFWQADIATIVLDHVVKNADGRGNYAIGSERKVGGTDVHLGFAVIQPIKRGNSGIYKITTHKDRGGYLQRGHLADLHLTSDPETHQISWELKPVEPAEEGKFRPTVLMQRVSAYLQGQDEPSTMTIIKSNVEGEDKYLAVAVDRLVEEDYATETSGPRNARLISHKVLFTGQDPPLRPSIQAETEMSQSQPTVSSHSPTPATPASPLRAGIQTTPAAASIAAGVAGDTQTTTPAEQVDVHDPAVQAQLDGYDSDIPF